MEGPDVQNLSSQLEELRMIRRGSRKSLFPVLKVCRASMTAFAVSIEMVVPGMLSVTATECYCLRRKAGRISRAWSASGREH